MSSSHSTFTSSSYSYSSSSSSNNVDGQATGSRQMHQSYTDPSGNTTTKSAHQNLGQPIVQETRNFDAQGREMLSGPPGSGSASRRIEDVSDDQQAIRDREYEERMEDEYAKREGGA